MVAIKAGKKVVPLRTARPCPICAKRSVQDYAPFCSKRCADIDLGHWLTGTYAIPAVEAEGEREEGEGDDDEE